MDYPSNNKSAPNNGPKREKRIESPVIEGKVVSKATPMGKRIMRVFMVGDPKMSFQESMVEVLVPGIRKVAFDTLRQSLERLILGNAGPIRRDIYNNARGTFGSNINYNKPLASAASQYQNPGPTQRSLTWQARAQHDFDQIVLENREDAAQVVGALQECIDQYGMARVSDLYDSLGITSDFTDEAWGWTDLTGAGATYSTDGYLLKLPKPIPLNK